MGNKRGRDAETGQFIPVEKAKANKKGAIVETIKPKPPKKPK